MSETTRQFKKQLPKNAVMSALSFLTYTISAIWLTPYLVRHLGVEAYGMVPIAGLLTRYVALITDQIRGAVTRFLSIEINKPDGDPNVIFNSALVLFSALVVLQVPVFWVGISYADQLFSIPQGLKSDMLILLGCSAGCFLSTLIGAVFGVSIFSSNRLDIGATVNLVSLVLRLLLIVFCFSMWGAKLRYIGYVDLALSLGTLPVNIYYWRRLSPELSISPMAFNWRVLWPMFDMSFWSLVNQLGGLLFLRMDIWVINRFISPAAAGTYAAILVLSNFIRQLGLRLTAQLAPVVMMYWAKKELEELRRLLLISVKYLSICLAIPASLISYNAGPFLGVWLGDEYAAHSLLLLVLCVHLPITVAMLPLFQIQTASNSIKIPALVTISMGILNVLLSYFLGVSVGMGALGVAIATAVVLTLRNVLFTALYGAHLVGLPLLAFFKPLLSGMLMFALTWLISMIPIAHTLGMDVTGFKGLLYKCVPATLLAVSIGWVFFVSKDDRRVMLAKLSNRVAK